MSEKRICEYCGNTEFHEKGVISAPEGKGQEHYFCQWACYILWRYGIEADPDYIYDESIAILVEWPYGRIRSEWEYDEIQDEAS